MGRMRSMLTRGRVERNAPAAISRAPQILIGLALVASAAVGQFTLDGQSLRVLHLLVAISLFGLFASALAGDALSRRAAAWVGSADDWLLARPARCRFLLAALMLTYAAGWCGVTFFRHYYFHSSFDLAIMDQVVWNASHGRFFARSIEAANDLGDHVRPYLTALGILYTVVASPYVLLAFQSVVLALSALPTYCLALRQLGSPAVALLMAFCLLAYPPLGFINRFDFHIEAVGIPLLILAFDRITVRDLRTASVLMALSLFCKENFGVTVAGLAVVSALVYRHWRFGAIWSVVGLAYSAIALLVVIPAFRGEPSDTLARYAWMGETPSGMAWALLSQPYLVFRKIATMEHVLSLLQSFAPFAFVPLAGWPALLPAVPTYLYNFLASHAAQSSIYLHYLAPVIPFVLIAAVIGLRRLQGLPRLDGSSPEIERRMALGPRAARAAVLMAAAVVASWIYQNPVTGNASVQATRGLAVVPIGASTPIRVFAPNDAAIREGLARVPPNVGLLTTTYYAPHLSQRAWIEMMPKAPVSSLPPEAEALFMNVRDLRAWSCDDYRQVIAAAAAAGFGMLFERDGVLVLRRDAGDPMRVQELARFWRGCE